MLKSSTYQDFSRYYDELTYDMPYQLWLDIIHRIQGHRNSVLDLGCGTGSLTHQLEFDEIHALDQSESMIEAAGKKGGKSVSYTIGDMKTFEFDRRFEMITATVDVMNYCSNPDEVRQVLEQVKKHLTDDGLFIFDIHSVFKMENELNDVTYSDETEHITYIWNAAEGDAPLSVIHDMSFFVKSDEDENLYIRFDETHIQRTYRHKDMLKMIDDAGLTVDTAFSDFDIENPVTEICDRVFYIVKKTL